MNWMSWVIWVQIFELGHPSQHLNAISVGNAQRMAQEGRGRTSSSETAACLCTIVFTHLYICIYIYTVYIYSVYVYVYIHMYIFFECIYIKTKYAYMRLHKHFKIAVRNPVKLGRQCSWMGFFKTRDRPCPTSPKAFLWAIGCSVVLLTTQRHK